MSHSPKHTPEPWHTYEGRGISLFNDESDAVIVSTPERSRSAYRVRDRLVEPTETDHANAARIVACVNACTGMDDPKEAIANAIKTLAACSLMFAEMKQTAPLEDILDAIRKLGCK